MMRLKAFSPYLFLCIGMLCASSRTWAQQDVQWTQYIFNPAAYLPGSPAVLEDMMVTYAARTQWVGFNQDGIGPRTQSISAELPIQAIQGGVGLRILNDRVGYETNTGVYAKYALGLDFAGGILAPGIEVGFLQRSLDGTNLRPVNPGDPSVPGGEAKAIVPDVNLGWAFQSAQWFAGGAITHIPQSTARFDQGTGNSAISLTRHWYLTAAYTYPLTGQIDLKPSVLFKAPETGRVITTDIHGGAMYNSRYYGGLGFRPGDAFFVNAGLGVNDQLWVSYSYDATVSSISRVSSGSHEIVIRYRIPVKMNQKTEKIIYSPRFL